MTYSGPKNIRVLDTEVKVLVKKLEGEAYAQYSPWGHFIQVSDEDMGSDVERRTILHELVHAIEHTNVEIKRLNETQVEQLALGIHSLIRNNKELIRWIQK